MKMYFRKLTVALCATLIFFVAPSCSDENKETDYIGGDDSEIEVKPAKYSDFKLYSGKTMLATVYGSSQVNVNGNQWYLNWERPVNITDDERARVVEEFSKPRPDSVNHIHVTWKNFWVQQVYKGTTEYVDGWGSNIGKGSDQMNVLQVFTNLKKEVISWWPYQDTLYVYDGDYLHINNFNSGNNTTVYTDDVTGQQYIGTTLMTDMGTDGRDNQFGYHNSRDNQVHFEYIILKIDGAYYLGFDYYGVHPDGQENNKNMDVERDWIFNDWIVKISPAQPLGGEPVDPDLDDEDEEEEDPIDPEELEYDFYLKDHVEVNLSINDKHEEGDWIHTKLSIHVRSVSDVEIFIPVPKELYLDKDDMDIVISHQLDLEEYIPQPTTESFTITNCDNGDEYEVSATVKFENEGIRITTQGMTGDLLAYLQKTYGDGLNFEIWNYYNIDEVDREALKPYLNATTVTFTASPTLFVNAFAAIGEDNHQNPSDCVVTPPSGYSVYRTRTYDKHEDYNVIYKQQ